MTPTHTLLIGNAHWQFFAYPTAKYKREFGSDSEAICFPQDHQIYFRKPHITPETIMHELIHALIASSNTNSSALSSEQTEELICELIPAYYYELGLWTSQLFKIMNAAPS